MFFARYALTMYFLMAALGAATSARAVCLDESGVSGYHVPLDKEMRTAVAVVLGKVRHKKDLLEDPSDPQGITATIYTVQIGRVVRGKPPTVIQIRSENDPGRLRMDVGKEYLLFLSRGAHQGFYLVDSCGNSGVAADRESVLRQIEHGVP